MLQTFTPPARQRQAAPYAPRRPAPDLDIAAATGPLALLWGEDVLVLVDDENLAISAQTLGYRLAYRRLGALLTRASRSCSLHTIFSREPDNEQRVAYFRHCGWSPHTRDIETVRTVRGLERRANADNLIAFVVGCVASRSSADVVGIGSGDGDLVCDLVAALSTLPKRRTIVTLSLAGSTSYRLKASEHRMIDDNIEIGLDCLHPLQQ